MIEMFNMMYRLIAPLVMLAVLIVAADYTASSIRQAKANMALEQIALSVAHAQACPPGQIPAAPNRSVRDPKTGLYSVVPCSAPTPMSPTTGMSDPATGCCHAQNWSNADGSAGNAGNSSNPMSGAGGQALQGVLGGLMQGIIQMLQPKPSSPGAPDDGIVAPVCKTLSVSPALPIEPGESATLTWVLDGGDPDSIVVSPGVGAVQGYSVSVSPYTSTTYTVIAKNKKGSSECAKVRVYVGPSNGEESQDSTPVNTSDAGTDIWDDTQGANTGPITGPTSRYDDIWENGSQGAQQQPNGQPNAQQNGQRQTTNDGEDYYNFLSSLAGSDDTLQEVAPQEGTNYGDYYYGGEGEIDWSAIESLDGGEATWQNADLQEGELGEAGLNGLELEARNNAYDYEYYQEGEYNSGTLANNTSGLTDEEIYGVWNRPQSPATGGIGVSGGFGGSSATNVPPLDLGEPVESTGFFASVGRWLKGTFCFWCN